MIKAENTPLKLWIYLAFMFIALRLPEIITALKH